MIFYHSRINFLSAAIFLVGWSIGKKFRSDIFLPLNSDNSLKIIAIMIWWRKYAWGLRLVERCHVSKLNGLRIYYRSGQSTITTKSSIWTNEKKAMDPIQYHPIGIIHTPHKTTEGTPIQPTGAKGVGGSIEVLPEYTAGLADLAGFSHIFILYHFHLSKKFSLKVKPFLDDQKRGLFATRAPSRPNPICRWCG